MASSKKSLTEQVLRRLAGGDTTASQRVHPKEVEKAIEQVLNLKLKTQVLEGFSFDDSIPQGCMIASYDNVPVTSWMGVSKCKLPAIPISLPKGMGVWRVGPAYAQNATGTNVFDDFIPIPPGQYGMVREQRLISDLLGQVGYEVRHGKEIVFTRDLPALSPAITAVNIQLVVSDLSQLGEYELLPIPADVEAEVVDTVYKMFAGVETKPNIVDPTNDSK